jgi:hypothetical protein
MGKKSVKVTLAILGLFVVVLLGVSLTLDSIIRSGVETVAPRVTGTSITLADVDISLISSRAGLNGFVIGNPEGFESESAFKLGKVEVDIDAGTIMDDVIKIESILIDGAEITWEGWAGDNHKKIMENVDTFTASDDKSEKKTEPVKKAEPGKKIIIKDFKFQNSSIIFFLGGKQIAKLEYPDLHLTDIGGKEGGQSIGETVIQSYDQIFASLGSSITKNKTMLIKNVMELSEENEKILQEGTEKVFEGVKKLSESLGDIFKKE